MDLGGWGYLTILDAGMALFFASCVFLYVRQLENRKPAPMGEQVGAHKAVLAKLRKGEPLTQDEKDYAAELVSDARKPLAYAIPAALFSMGFFYVVGCLFVLHEHGGNPSFRTFVGGIPMFTSMNIAVQLSKVARLKGALEKAPLAESVESLESEPAEELVRV